MQRIALLTSGGDAPGMNAAIRAVVRAGLASNVEIVGIERGYAGLLQGQLRPLDRAAVVNIIHRGGTILGTARCEEFKTRAGMDRAIEVLHDHHIDGLILIGGDGTFRGATELAKVGGPACVGVPGTIDNDVFGTDRSIGFDTAVNTALDAIDRVRDTATSHELLHFVEVMGRHSGWLAVVAGLAGGAEAVLCPELPDGLPAMVAQIRASISTGKRSVIVVVAEGFGDGGAATAEHVGTQLKLDYRITSLGHMQRGGAPTAVDRVTGGMLGAAAVDALLNRQSGVMLGEQSGAVTQVPFEQTWSQRNEVPDSLLQLLHRLG